MNKRAKKIFVVILDNRLVMCDTTLKALHKSFDELHPGHLSYITLFRLFGDKLSVEIQVGDKLYHLQKFIQPAK